MKPSARDIIAKIKDLNLGPNHAIVRNAHPVWHKMLLMEGFESRDYIKTLLDSDFTMREWVELHASANGGTFEIRNSAAKVELGDSSFWGELL